MTACKEIHAFCEIVCGDCCSFCSDIYIIQYTFHKLTDNNLPRLVYACLDPAESGFKCSNKHPHRCETHTWHRHILSCCFHSVIIQMDPSLNPPQTLVSTILDRIRTCPLHPTKLIIPLLSYVHSCRHRFHRTYRGGDVRERGATGQLCMSARMS